MSHAQFSNFRRFLVASVALEAVAPTAEMRTKMALRLARLNRFPEAQTELEAALQIDANFAPAQRMLADVKRRFEGK